MIYLKQNDPEVKLSKFYSLIMRTDILLLCKKFLNSTWSSSGSVWSWFSETSESSEGVFNLWVFQSFRWTQTFGVLIIVVLFLCPDKGIAVKRVPKNKNNPDKTDLNIRVPKFQTNESQTKQSQFLWVLLIAESLFHILTASLRIGFDYLYQLVKRFLLKLHSFKL